MKRIFHSMVLALVLSVFIPMGAASETTVAQNSFTTDLAPSLTVKISQEFKYIGGLQSYRNIRNETTNSIGTEKIDYYIFVDADEENRTRRVLFMRISVPPDNWRRQGGGVYGNVKRYLTKGTEKIDGIDYEYYVHLNSKVASDELFKLIEKKGYKYHQCSCQKRMGAYFQSKRLEIVYTENTASFGLPCDTFNGKNAVDNDRQKEYIKSFLDRCSKAFQTSIDEQQK